jgi:hypothetical protein
MVGIKKWLPHSCAAAVFAALTALALTYSPVAAGEDCEDDCWYPFYKCFDEEEGCAYHYEYPNWPSCQGIKEDAQCDPPLEPYCLLGPCLD